MGDPARDLAAALRVLVVLERRVQGPHAWFEVALEALAGGARALQLRNKGDSAQELFEAACSLREPTRAYGALLFVNDRLDVALAADADGVHVGPDDVPVAAIRAAAPTGFLIGRSADDPQVARQAVIDGADYIGCGTVFETSTKPDAGEVIGVEGLRTVVESVQVPVVGIGGITPSNAPRVAAAGAAGVAVVGAVMAAPDPRGVVAELLAAFGDA